MISGPVGFGEDLTTIEFIGFRKSKLSLSINSSALFFTKLALGGAPFGSVRKLCVPFAVPPWVLLPLSAHFAP